MSGKPTGSRRSWLIVALSIPVLLAVVAVAFAWWVHRPMRLDRPVVELSIELGTNPREVARQWSQAGVQEPPWLLYEWFRWSGQATRIRAGSYAVSQDTSPRELLNKMVEGDEVLGTVRLIEGWTFRQFREALARAPDLRPATAGMDDAAVMMALGAASLKPEGRFFPDTYRYGKGVSDLTVLRRAHDTMNKRLQAVWADRVEGLPLRSADEALILASIVEKETGVESDRRLVAGVFVNRLRIGMPLQTDPTVIYGLGETFDGNLRKRDLLNDTPWNTYTRNGLPPTPIAMPGLAALRAAVRPQETRALYFVARGDGTSVFSETLEEHNRAVNRYQRGR